MCQSRQQSVLTTSFNIFFSNLNFINQGFPFLNHYTTMVQCSYITDVLTLILTFCVFQCALPELDNPLSKKVRSIISGLLETRPNSMKVSYQEQHNKWINTGENILVDFGRHELNCHAVFNDLCLPLVGSVTNYAPPQLLQQPYFIF